LAGYGSGWAVAADIDGTITEDGGRVSLSAFKAVRRLVEEGFQVFFVSARDPASTMTVSALLGASDYAVAEGGGVIVRLVKRRIEILKILGRREVSLKAVEVLRGHFGSMVRELSFPVRFVDVALERSFPLREALEVLNRHEVEAKIFDSGYAYHVTPREVDKGRGLKTLLEILNIEASRVVAVGDSLQDLEMFRSAGFSIALANAPEELRRNANSVTSKPYGEGFAEAANYILKNFHRK